MHWDHVAEVCQIQVRGCWQGLLVWQLLLVLSPYSSPGGFMLLGCLVTDALKAVSVVLSGLVEQQESTVISSSPLLCLTQRLQLKEQG